MQEKTCPRSQFRGWPEIHKSDQKFWKHQIASTMTQNCYYSNKTDNYKAEILGA